MLPGNDRALEALDFTHRLYESEESVKILGTLITQIEHEPLEL